MKTARMAVEEFRAMQNSDDGRDDDVVMESSDDSAPMPPPPPTTASTSASLSNGMRRRALSMAETQASVETVIVKAKRAAQSLWMLLHAQSCVLASRCPHTGFQEAKLLHLHLKTCNAGPNGECPMSYHGCDQSRKLLAHYRRCRTLRARQHANGGLAASANKTNSINGQGNGGSGINSSSSSNAHHCLVCSLMARQARTVLEQRKVSSSSMIATSNKTMYHGKKSSSSNGSNKITSYSLPSSFSKTDNAAMMALLPRRDKAATFQMCPPPPRMVKASADVGATAVGQNGSRAGNHSNNGSLDSLARLYATAKQLDGDESHWGPSSPRRERAASDTDVSRMDVVSTQRAPPATTERRIHDNDDISTNSSSRNDDDDDIDDDDDENAETVVVAVAKRRERSASCGTASLTTTNDLSELSMSLSMPCETIAEEENLTLHEFTEEL